MRLSAGQLEVAVERPPFALDTGPVTLAVRADAVRLTPAGQSGTADAHIAFASNRGASALYEITTNDGQSLQAAEERRGAALRLVGSNVGVALLADACTIVRP